MPDSKIERQIELERQSVYEGAVRYRENLNNQALGDVGPGKKLLRRTMEGLEDAIQELLDAGDRAGRGRPSVFMRYFREFEPAVLAYATARGVINAFSDTTPTSLNRLAIRIATSLQEAQMYNDMKPLEPGLYFAMEQKAKKSTTTSHARAVMNTAARVASEKHQTVTGLGWDDREKMIMGVKLVEIFIEQTGLAQVETHNRGKTQQLRVTPTPQTVEWLEKQHGECELLAPIYYPMIVPPVPWVQPIGGGYLAQESAPSIPMIRTRDRDTLDEYFSTDMPEVYAAVNAIQATAWRINRKVLPVLEEMVHSNSGQAGLPRSGDRPIPSSPDDIVANPEAFKEWKKVASGLHQENARNASKRMSLGRQLFVANKMLDEEEIFFPHSLDFRGRIYPIPYGITPQADDSGKSLLEFADGKPLGESGGFWLAVHVANLFGFDKASLEDRVQWVLDNETMVLDSALDPLDGQCGWMAADKPFCFLAACIEWAGFKTEGDTFVSHLPIAMDGSCSGLQHYSALLKDSIGGEAVNLVPKDRPSDIYTTVAQLVTQKLITGDYNPRDDQQRADKLAAAWLGLVVRKIVKQPCMTYAYSATGRGMRDQIVDAMRKLDDAGGYVPGWSEWDAANFLSPIVQQAIRETVVAASSAMDWLQGAIVELNKQQLPCIWETPVGLPVIQREMEYVGKRVTMLMDGRQIKLSYAVTSDKLNRRKQKSGIAPNYIHSMDSAHLMKTVNGCAQMGGRHFAMIHDSFGVHACDTDELNVVLREQFVDMYSDDWLSDFRMRAERLLGKELPDIPPVGDLNLSAVEESDFFFA